MQDGEVKEEDSPLKHLTHVTQMVSLPLRWTGCLFHHSSWGPSMAFPEHVTGYWNFRFGFKRYKRAGANEVDHTVSSGLEKKHSKCL
ncbi:hypothetical protein NPIL_597531 [Nephila pilipes]|uniref:Uncharacterized protein n=1 Tax=Nephila pilipes TaxID=299642 RepID=A0A8X6Q1T1_NEPPI|nr:hypothetical protein NPIL_597531 [Nephila pilipes]